MFNALQKLRIGSNYIVCLFLMHLWSPLILFSINSPKIHSHAWYDYGPPPSSSSLILPINFKRHTNPFFISFLSSSQSSWTYEKSRITIKRAKSFGCDDSQWRWHSDFGETHCVCVYCNTIRMWMGNLH